jgi:alpha-N-acetylglucosaminidase
VTSNASLIISIIGDLDELAATRTEFLLGNWISDAQSWATNQTESLLYTSNAKLQLTLWGYATSDLPDYAGKLWSGLLSDFYLPRWVLFCKTLQASVSSKQPFPSSAYLQEVIKIEEAWTMSASRYPTSTTGDALSVAGKLYAKYADLYTDVHEVTTR